MYQHKYIASLLQMAAKVLRAAQALCVCVCMCAHLSFLWEELASCIGSFVSDERKRFSKNAYLKQAVRFEAVFSLLGLLWVTRSQRITVSGVSGATFSGAKRRLSPLTVSSIPSRCFC